jgi:uncharacterized protein (DUF1800 family)
MQIFVSAIALNRFGIGARPGDAIDPAQAPGHLVQQLERYDAKPLSNVASTAEAMQVFASYQSARQAERQTAPATGKVDATKVGALIRPLYARGITARIEHALATETPFAERLVHFWSNHFTVSGTKPLVTALAAAHENDAIRPQILGRFEDLLIAAVRHPAMLVYLDQATSFGPDSVLAQRQQQRDDSKKRGLNENLAREILELHTLGVDGGYTQSDVTEFARAMTGITLADSKRLEHAQKIGARLDSAGEHAIFVDGLHEPGARTVLGVRYPQAGLAQSTAVLRSLARHPATALHIATKLARHFVADTPPPALVTRLADTFLKAGGDLRALYRALIESPESWSMPLAKFKTPWEHVLSSLRAVGATTVESEKIIPLFQQLGQAVFHAPSPAGWADMTENWAAPDALFKRVEYVTSLASQAGGALDARALGARLLPGTLGASTTQAIARAETAPQALALLLASPEFLRR